MTAIAIRTFLLVVAVLSLPALADDGWQQRVEEAMNRGIEAQRAGYRNQALPHYQSALAILVENGRGDSKEAAVLLSSIAGIHDGRNEGEKAIAAYERSLPLLASGFGRNHAYYDQSRYSLGELYVETGRFEEAESLLLESLAFREKNHATDGDSLAWCVSSLCNLYRRTDQPEKLAPLLSRRIKFYKDRCAATEPIVFYAILELARLNVRLRRLEQAKSNFQEGINLMAGNAEVGPEGVGLADPLVEYAEVCVQLRLEPEAEEHFARSLHLVERFFGDEHPRVIPYLRSLLRFHFLHGHDGSAEQLAERLLRISERHYGSDHPATVEALQWLASIYQSIGLAEKTVEVNERILDAFEQHHGAKHESLVGPLSVLATHYRDSRQLTKAESYGRRALEIARSRYGEQHDATAGALAGLGMILQAAGRYEEAERLLNRSLEIKLAVHGRSSAAIPFAMDLLAGFYQKTGDYTKAEALYKESLDLRAKSLGAEHPSLGSSYAYLAKLHAAFGRFAAAASAMERAVELLSRGFGEGHSSLIPSRTRLVNYLVRSGAWEAAFAEADRARKVAHRYTVDVLPALTKPQQAQFLRTSNGVNLSQAYSIVLRRPGHPAAAVRGCEWTLNTKGMNTEVLTERIRLTTMAGGEWNNRAASELAAIRKARASLQSAAHSADTADAERSKRMSESLAEVRRIRLDELGTRQTNLLSRIRANSAEHAREELQEVRKRIAELVREAPAPGPDARQAQQLPLLRAREEDLTQQLSRIVGWNDFGRSWVDVAQVRAVLPADGVLLEIVRVVPLDLTSLSPMWKPPRYAMFVVPPVGGESVRIIDLGEATQVDRAVVAVRDAIASAGDAIDEFGMASATRDAQEKLKSLAALVLAPVEGSVASKTVWLISPDAATWLIPWAALPLSDGSYAIKSHRISLLSSGRDLVRRLPSTESSGPVIFANPDFEYVFDSDSEIPGESATSAAGALGEKLASWELLSGTVTEADAVSPSLSLYAGRTPSVKTDADASEAAFKLIANPRVLLVSTHAFFSGVMPTTAMEETSAERGVLSPTGIVYRSKSEIADPLTHCGLVLAGANRRQRSDAEDGILTGTEVIGTDLRGTELVVLSACETGTGVVQPGEGVAGLRQAFHLAGAKAVLATLWRISDRETSDFVARFFKELSSGQTEAEALQSTQIWMLEREDLHGSPGQRRGPADLRHVDRDLTEVEVERSERTASPYYWAGFTLSGKWR